MNSEADAKKKELIEAKNIAEQLVYTSEKSLKDGGDKVPADIKSNVEAKIADLKKIKDGEDLTAIKSATEALSGELQKIGEAMAKQQQAQATENSQQKTENAEEKKPEDGAKEEGSATEEKK